MFYSYTYTKPSVHVPPTCVLSICIIYTILVPCIIVYLSVSALTYSVSIYGYVAIGSSAIHNTVASTVIKHIYKYLYSLATCLLFSLQLLLSMSTPNWTVYISTSYVRVTILTFYNPLTIVLLCGSVSPLSS